MTLRNQWLSGESMFYMFYVYWHFVFLCWSLLGVACWWNSICELFYSIDFRAVLLRIKVPNSLIDCSLSEFSLSSSHLVKMFVSLCSPQCSVSFALSIQQCWHFQLPFSYIYVNECFYSLFFSLLLFFIRSSFGVFGFCSFQVLEDLPISWAG